MSEFLPIFDWTNLLIIPSLLIGYTIHELGHALTAYFLGDYSQVERGKITLNPLEHISWFGSLAFILFGIGWPKPLQANLHHLKRKHLDMFLVAMAGPLASLTFALLSFLLTLTIATALVYASGAATDKVLALLFPTASHPPQSLNIQAWSIAFIGYLSTTSFWLAFISLLPLPGLDGFAALVNLAAYWRERKNSRLGHRPSGPPPILALHPLPLMNQQERRNSAAELHFKKGAEYHQAGQYEDAIARYRQAISNDQSFGPAYINLGLAYLARGDRKKAIQAFRGALQNADDQKSQAEAWHQLHLLSEISPVAETAQTDLAELGAAPWTDTRPRPNWLGMGITSALLFIGAIFLYGYLVNQLLELLRKT